MQKIAGVRRAGDKNIYYFLQNEDYEIGDRVVVDFDEFQTVASVCKKDIEIDDSKAQELVKIKRRATSADIKKYEELSKKAKDNMVQIKRKSLELGLMMKFVCAEYSLDGSKVVIVFSSEERVDFRQFLKDLATMLKTRIELKQIGQRDEVKVVGGVGPCGEPCCCARFLKDFEHVTVKMAKVQGLSLSPTKINGICGRLMCCLGYESKMYEETLARMPKIGTELVTPNGKGNVVYNDILRERVSVKRMGEGDTFVVEDFDLEDINMETKVITPKPVEVKPEVKEESEIKPAEEKPAKKDFSNKKPEQKPNHNKQNQEKNNQDKQKNQNNDGQKSEKPNKPHFGKRFHHKNKQKPKNI